MRSLKGAEGEAHPQGGGGGGPGAQREVVCEAGQQRRVQAYMRGPADGLQHPPGVHLHPLRCLHKHSLVRLRSSNNHTSGPAHGFGALLTAPSSSALLA